MRTGLSMIEPIWRLTAAINSNFCGWISIKQTSSRWIRSARLSAELTNKGARTPPPPITVIFINHLKKEKLAHTVPGVLSKLDFKFKDALECGAHWKLQL